MGTNNSGKIYYPNGQLCWSDPEIYSNGGHVYNRYGTRVSSFNGLTQSSSIDLGEGSRLDLHPGGKFTLTVHLGNGCYLIRNQYHKMYLSMDLQSGLHLQVHCEAASDEPVWLFDDANNWLKIADSN